MPAEFTFDYARGKKIWGNGLCVDQYFYRYLLDGKTSTLWKSRYPYIKPQYIIVDLEKDCRVNRVIIREPRESIGDLTEFSIELSMNGTEWENVEIFIKKGDNGENVCDFTQAETRFIRINLLKFNEKKLSLTAIEVYNTQDKETFPVPTIPKQKEYQPEVIKSNIVFDGEDGFLHYRPYDDLGNCIPDFSNVGYKGGAEIPENVEVKAIVEPWGEDSDDTLRIQDAIDYVSKLPLDENGYRGAILLKKGRYKVTDTIFIRNSGVVLMGEGQDEDGTVVYVDFNKKAAFLSIEGENDFAEIEGTRRKIKEDFIPVGCKTFTLEDASGYSVGDDVVLHVQKNQNWVDALNMGEAFFDVNNGKVPWSPELYQYRYQSKVVSVCGDCVTVDQPIVDYCDRRYGEYELYRYSFDGRISNCGVFNLRAISSYDKEIVQHHDLYGRFFSDDNHADTGVYFDCAEDCWVKNFSAVHFGNNCICVWRLGKRITVDSCKFLQPVSTLVGGNRYAFSLNGQQNLVENCYSECGRHDFVVGGRTEGPNVFVNCIAENSYQNSENHHRWGTGVLYDNVSVNGPNTYLSSGNRGDCATGHGWSGANIIFWNCTSPIIVVQKPPLAENLAIGVSAILDHKTNMRPVLDAIDWYNQQGSTDMPYDGNTIWGDGYKEALTNTVTPRSLYIRQLEDKKKKERRTNECTKK